MKTKLIFATMVLPALFAACTADEMMENSSANLQGRALLDPITVNVVSGNADTRFSWNEANYGWNGFTAEDKFSAGLVDDASGTIQDKVLTNYVFSTADGTSYTTTSQMVEGAYMFYSYPGFETSAARAEVAFDLTSQVKVDLNNPTATVEENQLFVTPLYRLTKESANEKLNMKFISYWSTAAIAVKNTSKQSFKVVRVLLRSTANDFAVAGKISPVAMTTAGLIYSYDKESGEYVLPEDVNADAIRTADIAAAGADMQQTLYVDCQSYEVAAGKSATIYIQVPAGVYANNLTVEVVAEVTANNVTSLKSLLKAVVKNAKSDASVPANDRTQFSRGKTMAVFGVENGAPAAYEVDDIELLTADDASGLYASSYEDMYNYLTDADLTTGNTAGNPLNIYNLGTLSLDDKLMTLMGRLQKHVKFINAIKIESESRTSATLDYAQFAAGASIKKGTIVIGGNVVLPAGQILTIDEEAAATAGAGVTATKFRGTIKNNGTLNMAGTTATAITCGGKAVINITANQDWTSAYAMAKTMTVAEGATLDFNADATNAYGKKITNNGIITVTGATFTNNGTIDNYGVIDAVDNLSTVVSGEKKTAVVNNYGKITALNGAASSGNFEGSVVMKSADAEVTTATNYGTIDNTVGGFITDRGNHNVDAIYTGNQSGKIGNVMQVTRVYLTSGTWTNPSVPAGLATLYLNSVTMTNTSSAISLRATNLYVYNSPSVKAKDGVTLAGSVVSVQGSTFGSATTINATTSRILKNATFNGALTLSGSLTALTLCGTTFNGTVTATNVKNVTVDSDYDDSGNPVAATTTVNAAVTLDPLNDGTLVVNDKATLDVTVNGSIGTDGKTAATVNAGGTVNNKGAISGSTKSVSGTWKGNDIL